MDNKFLLILLGLGAYYLYSQSGAGGGGGALGYTDSTGNPITTAKCGTPISFVAGGRSSVWITQTQNGNPQYNGPLALPMKLYPLRCPEDVGTFAAAVYEMGDNGPGALIGNVSCTVTA